MIWCQLNLFIFFYLATEIQIWIFNLKSKVLILIEWRKLHVWMPLLRRVLMREKSVWWYITIFFTYSYSLKKCSGTVLVYIAIRIVLWNVYCDRYCTTRLFPIHTPNIDWNFHLNNIKIKLAKQLLFYMKKSQFGMKNNLIYCIILFLFQIWVLGKTRKTYWSSILILQKKAIKLSLTEIMEIQQI